MKLVTPVLVGVLFLFCALPTTAHAQYQSSLTTRKVPIQEIIPIFEKDLEETKDLLKRVVKYARPNFKSLNSKVWTIEELMVYTLEAQGQELTNYIKDFKNDPKSSVLIDRPIRWTQTSTVGVGLTSQKALITIYKNDEDK